MTNSQAPLPEATARHLRQLYLDAQGQSQRRVDGYIWLLRKNGWTLRSIGDALGVTREAVRLRLLDAGPVGGLPPVELPPVPPTPLPKRPQRSRLKVSPALARELRAELETASTVNGATPADDPRRTVSVRLTERLAALVDQGVAIKELARALGVTHNAVKFRLGRHGHRALPPSMANAHYLGRPTRHQPSDSARGVA